jgi:hypothetical protein
MMLDGAQGDGRHAPAHPVEFVHRGSVPEDAVGERAGQRIGRQEAKGGFPQRLQRDVLREVTCSDAIIQRRIAS